MAFVVAFALVIAFILAFTFLVAFLVAFAKSLVVVLSVAFPISLSPTAAAFSFAIGAWCSLVLWSFANAIG